MTREEHLQWCKDRALEYANSGDLQQAVASMISDLRKHEGTSNCLEFAQPLGMLVLLDDNVVSVKEFIHGFN